MGVPELGRDPRYARFPDRLRARDALTGMLDGLLSQRTTAEWLSIFGGAIPAAPIHDVAQALQNPFIHARGMVETLRNAEGAEVTLLANPVRSTLAARPSSPAPALGADTDAVLAEAGFDAAEIATLRDAGVV
jgi:crotonobetainyl-CoA:carnitine CoA-transferase CaiB-like acyl-CoA transferase